MAYVKLLSESGEDALRRALEAPPVARIAKGKLTVDDALGMQEREAVSAFQMIRWADTKGLPKCPKCASTETYEIRRGGFRCQHCSHDFSVTSSTMLHGRKMGMSKYLAMLALVLDKEQFRSLLAFSNETGIGYKTVWAQINYFRVCAGENGCTVPFTILTRAAWQARMAGMRSNLGRFMTHPKDLNYPYITEGAAKTDGAALLTFVSRWVPRWIPEHLRADICQDMVLEILTGEATREQIRANVKKYIAKNFAAFPWKYKWMSFDAPLYSEGGRTLHDVFSEERAAEAFERVA